MPNHNSQVVYIPREFESRQGPFIESLMPGIRTAPNLTVPDNQKLRRFKNKSRYSRNNRYTRITGLPRSVYNKLYRQRSTRKKSRAKKSKQPKKVKKGGTRKKKKKIRRKKSFPKKSRRNARGKRKRTPTPDDIVPDDIVPGGITPQGSPMRTGSPVYDRSQDVDKTLNEMRRHFGLPPYREAYRFPRTPTPRASPYKKGQAIGEIENPSKRHKLEMSRI